MGDDLVNIAHRLIVLARGFGGVAVELAVHAGALHAGSPQQRDMLEQLAGSIERGARDLRALIAEETQ